MFAEDWIILGAVLMLAGLVGWLGIWRMAKRDRDPEVENMWPEWWEEAPPEDRGLRVLQVRRLADRVPRVQSWPGGAPDLAPIAARVRLLGNRACA